MGNLTKITHKKKRFLELFEKFDGHVSDTCKAVKMSRRHFYTWCEKDPDFAQAVNEIREASNDDIERRLKERAFGKYGDTVLIFLAKTRLRHRGYSERVESFNVNVDFDYRKIANIDNIEDAEKEIKRLEQLIRPEES